jgi:hypothetical protein
MGNFDEFIEIGARATDDPSKGPGFRIKHLWACLAVDPQDNAEGLPAIEGTIHGRPLMLTLIAADETRLAHMRELAIQLGRQTRQRIVLAKFTVREDLEVLYDPRGGK